MPIDMKKPVDVTGIGNAILDIIARADDAFLQAHGMRKGDMALIDDKRAEELYGKMGQTQEVSGGSVANSIAGLAMLGAKTAFIGRVKDDQFGKVYQHDMKTVGVDFRLPAMQEGSPTGCSYILVTPDGERTMNTYLGAGSEIYEDDIDVAVIGDSKIVFGEGYQWATPHNIAALKKAFAVAKEAGTLCAFSLSAVFCVQAHREDFLALIAESIDILFTNEDEVRALYPQLEFDAIADELQGQADVVVITRSEKGSLILTPDQRIEVKPEVVAKVVDATGAGDLYAAGFLYGYTRGMPLQKCGELGSKCAAEIIQQLGARALSPLAKLVA